MEKINCHFYHLPTDGAGEPRLFYHLCNYEAKSMEYFNKNKLYEDVQIAVRQHGQYIQLDIKDPETKNGAMYMLPCPFSDIQEAIKFNELNVVHYIMNFIKQIN